MAESFFYYQAASDEHKKRERAKAQKLRKSQWWKQQLSNGECYYCGGRFAIQELTMDHKVPIARGGTSSKGNIVVSCKSCNTEKKCHTPVEMILHNQ